MNNKYIVLLKALLKSTSGLNIIKYSKDRKKRNRIIGGYVGVGILYLYLLSFCAAIANGYVRLGLVDSIPTMSVLLISSLSFIFTLLKSNGYLFGFKEYDMLMSMPFETKTVAACKFMYMYVKNLPHYLIISLAMMLAYGLYAETSPIVYIMWIALSFFVPVIPMLVAALIGYVIAKLGSGFRMKKMVQTIFMFAFIILCFSLRYIIDALFEHGNFGETLEEMSAGMKIIERYYLPGRWFTGAVTRVDFVSMLLLIIVTSVLFELSFILVARSYRKINSALSANASGKAYKLGALTRRNVVLSVAYKEYKRFTGSVLYMTNVGFGAVAVLIIGVLSLIVGIDRVLETMFQGAPMGVEAVFYAFPFFIHMFTGMVPSTVCSPSLEGKNYWIIESLPIDKKDLYKGKMLFNLILFVPAAVISMMCIAISAGASLTDTLLCILLLLVLSAFSTVWGCVCGLKHIRLDWENEVEVIKQGAGVVIYLFPNLFITMVLMVGIVLLRLIVDTRIVVLGIMAVLIVLTLLCYRRVMKLAERRV